MLNTSLQACRAGLAAALLALASPWACAQATQPAEPGAGFANPRTAPPRATPPDSAHVWRAPSIDTLATVRQRGLLRVGVVPVEPMVMRNKRGDLVGFSIDLSRRLAADIGVDVEFVVTSWADVVPDLLGRQFDIVATGLWPTVQRALVVNFTEPTVVEGIHLVAAKSRAGAMKTRADFNQPGITISVYADTPQAALARRLFPRATLVAAEPDELTPVLQGRAHAALVPTIAPEALLRSAPEQLFLPLDRALSVTQAAIAVRKGDSDILNFLNTWLTLQRFDGWLDERALFWATSTEWLK